jgi:hypothetical protein
MQPGNPAEVERLVEQKTRERTFGRVRHLRVELSNGRIVVHGATRLYYVKSLALEAAREVLASIGPIPLPLDIQVT